MFRNDFLGTGVITGSPPNLVVPDVLKTNFGDETGLTFASWMAFAIPVMLLNTILAWIWLLLLQRLYLGNEICAWKMKLLSVDRCQAPHFLQRVLRRWMRVGVVHKLRLQIFSLF